MPTSMIDSLAGDLRYAIRHYARTPVATATIVLVLSLGIGVNAALFSVIRSFTTRAAPGVTADDAVVRLRGTERLTRGGRLLSRGFSFPEYKQIAAQTGQFSAVASWVVDDVVVVAGGGFAEPSAATAQFVAGDYFGILGVRPVIGSSLASRDDASMSVPTAVIGYSMWRDMFDGATDVLGRHLNVNGVAVTIAGVAPERFLGATRSNSRQMLWMPLFTRTLLGRSTPYTFVSSDSMFLSAIARLKPGTSVQQADAVVHALAASAAGSTPRDRLRSADVVPLRGDTDLPSNNELVVVASVFGAIALLILLVACTNASALLVGLGVARQHEIAVRLSLGASRPRIVKQLLTESSLLAVGAAAIGLILYWWAIKLLGNRLPRVELAPDLTTALYTAALAVLVGVVFGLSPALHGTRRSLSSAIKVRSSGTMSASRLQQSFVVAQIALTQPLLVGLVALLAVAIKGAALGDVNPLGGQILSLRFELSHRYVMQKGVESADPNAAGIQDLRERIASLPGVGGVTTKWSGVRFADLAPHPANVGVADAEAARVKMETTAPGYFALMGIPLLRGRDFIPQDTAGEAMAAIVGSDLARALWGSADPVGKRLMEASDSNSGAIAVVVGVIDATRQPQSDDGRWLVHVARKLARSDGLLIRTSGPAAALASTIRGIARAHLPQLAISELATLTELERARREEAIQVSATTAAAGILALFLAAIGLYGVVSVAVEQRRREVGIRVALGAQQRQILAQFFGRGLRMSATGLAIGLPLSVLALHALVDMLEVPAPSIPVVGFSIAVAVLAVAFVATWIPAGRAASVDPLIALRSD